MTGIELTVAGWIAPTAIRTVVDVARSYLGSNYDKHKKTRDMLDNLEITLPRIQIAITMAEQRPSQSKAMGDWLKKMKLAASEAEDVLDDFEAKVIHEKLKGKSKVSEFISASVKTIRTTIFSDKELKRLEETLGRLQLICSGVGDFLKTMELNDKDAIEGSTNIDKRETSSCLPKNMKIFGRDKEIELILNMILGYDPFYAGENNDNAEPESGKGEMSSIFPGLDIIPRFGKMVLKMVRPRETLIVSTDLSNQPFGSDKLESSQGQTNIRDIYSSKEQKISGDERDGPWNIEVNNWSLGVLPIVGITGVGKTTLAQTMYNNQIIKQQFSLQAWVYVSDIFNSQKLMENIISSLSGRPIVGRFNLDSVQHELICIIRNKKFFLVLDDVWDDFSDSVWTKIFLPVLTEGAPGSVVLVTTQSQKVADMMRTLRPIKLDALPWEYFWPLFKYHAFGHVKFCDKELNTFLPSNENEISELESIGKKIAEKLHCIPLEAEIIGYILNKNLDKGHWIKILKTDWWNATCTSKYILPSLGIGYQSLDPELKQCLLYGSIFPKGYVFEKHRLVQMWISHGFVQPTKMDKIQVENREKRLEDIGDEMFGKLVDRFFFQPTVWENNYVMHDLIRDLAIVISSNEFCIINNDSESIPPFTCHLSLNNDHLVRKPYDSSNEKLQILLFPGYEKLRTLMFHGCFTKNIDTALATIFKKPSSLRLLDLSYKMVGGNGFPSNFTELSHLRFLDLSFSGIGSLFDNISDMCHLQVLDLRGCIFKKLPKGIHKLINLRHIYASVETISLIYGIGNLINLQELENFRIQLTDGYKINELKNLNEIRGELGILDIGSVSTKKEATECNLSEKRHLNSLTLKWSYGFQGKESTKEIVQSLIPPPNLEKLEMHSYPITHCVNWMVQNGNFNKLKHVKICGGFLQVLPPFGELTSLETLNLEHLGAIKKINPEFYGFYEVAFPSLKELSFSCLNQWEDWSTIEGRQAFPKLRILKLECCSKLKEIGTILGQMRAITQLTVQSFLGWVVTSLSCECLRSVEVLYLRNVIINIVEGTKYLLKLKKLNMTGACLKIHSPQKLGFQMLTNLTLQEMMIEDICIFAKLPLLQTLELIFICGEFTVKQETWFGQQTSIEELVFSHCNDLKHIPSSISMLLSLKKLTIESCPSVKSTPNRLPQNLKELHIIDCSKELMERCVPEKGKDWPNISHVPCIRIVNNLDRMYKRLTREGYANIYMNTNITL